MLDRPIDQADIDNGTLFKVREGGTARVIGRRNSIDFPWVVEYSDIPVCAPWVTSNGCWNLQCRPNSLDLIARIKEPNMESQVAVEDKRCEFSDAATAHSFASFENGRILKLGGGEIYLKVGDGGVIQLTGADAGNFHHMNAVTQCKHLPHLRLRLVLEDRS